MNFRALLALRLRLRSIYTDKLYQGQFTALLTVEFFSRGGGQNFSTAKNYFLSVRNVTKVLRCPKKWSPKLWIGLEVAFEIVF